MIVWCMRICPHARGVGKKKPAYPNRASWLYVLGVSQVDYLKRLSMKLLNAGLRMVSM